MKIFFKTILIPLIVLFYFIPWVALAAEISLSLPQSVNVGENFEVLINGNTDGVLINSVNIILDYDQDLMSFSGYKSDGTVISLWVDSPNEQNGNIYMSGIIPGGVFGLYDPNKQGLEAIPLARLFFTAKKDGNAVFSFIKTEIFKHDGKGTSLIHTDKGGKVTIRDKVIAKSNEIKVDDIFDNEKPEPFEITLVEPSIFGETPLMIIFNANDTGSGIKEYKINDGALGVWKNVQSPQEISQGILSRNVTIRAFDFYGNFQDSSIRIPGFGLPRFLWIILILIIFCIVGYKVLKYKA